MATKRSSPSQSKPEAAAPPEPYEGEMRSPFIPLLWLLIPFAAVVIYGIATSPRFSH
jgi:hypothetical protein